MCRRYKQRPSDVVGISDRMLALDFDLAMAAIHRAEDVTRAEQAGPLARLLADLT